jgi:hypothetical protein
LANALLMFPPAIEEEIRKTPKPKDAIIPFGTFFCVANWGFCWLYALTVCVVFIYTRKIQEKQQTRRVRARINKSA